MIFAKEYKEEGQCAQKGGRILVFVICSFIKNFLLFAGGRSGWAIARIEVAHYAPITACLPSFRQPLTPLGYD